MMIIDISMPICNEMPIYKGNPSKKPLLKVERDFKSDFNCAAVYESKIEMNLHTGTHLDAPLHLFQSGSSIDQLDLRKVVTRCKVFDLTGVAAQISRADLTARNIVSGDFIIFKTKNSFLDILETEFIYLDKTGAEYLKSKGVVGVGIDALGIERNQPAHETHRILLESGFAVLEGLRLKEVSEGEYLLVAAPIFITGAEAAPVRALLIKER